MGDLLHEMSRAIEAIVGFTPLRSAPTTIHSKIPGGKSTTLDKPHRRSGQPYDEAKAFQTTPASLARRFKNLQNQAKALNMTLVPA